MPSPLSFELCQPLTPQAAVAALAAVPGARLLAGGTDLLPNLRRGLGQPALLVSLDRSAGIGEIMRDDEGLWLGAGITLARLAADAPLRREATAIGQAAASVAGPGHRSAATLGGNLCQDTRCVYYNLSAWWRAANDHCLKLDGTVCHVAPQGRHCHAAFCSDLAPALLVLQAEVELFSPRGTRRIALAELYRDDGAAHLTLASDEMLLRVRVPAPAQAGVTGYRKGRVRGAMDFALAGVAMALRMDGSAIAALRVAITGTDPRPLLLDDTAALLGRRVDADTLALLGKRVGKQVGPARSTVTPSNHRRLLAVALAQRLLQELARP